MAPGPFTFAPTEPAEIRVAEFEPIGEPLPEPEPDRKIPTEYAEVVEDTEYDDEGYKLLTDTSVLHGDRRI